MSLVQCIIVITTTNVVRVNVNRFGKRALDNPSTLDDELLEFFGEYNHLFLLFGQLNHYKKKIEFKNVTQNISGSTRTFFLFLFFVFLLLWCDGWCHLFNSW